MNVAVIFAVSIFSLNCAAHGSRQRRSSCSRRTRLLPLPNDWMRLPRPPADSTPSSRTARCLSKWEFERSGEYAVGYISQYGFRYPFYARVPKGITSTEGMPVVINLPGTESPRGSFPPRTAGRSYRMRRVNVCSFCRIRRRMHGMPSGMKEFSHACMLRQHG